MSQSRVQVLIMAGGTGGHVFPALAVARELEARGLALAWLGTRRGIEARLVPLAGIALHFLRIQGVRGRGWLGLFKAPFLLVGAVTQALFLMRRLKPGVVLGFGGFASGPGGLAAKLLGIPLVIHEQNSVPGTTNRYLAPWARRVLTAFPCDLPRAELVGNPVRQALFELPPPEQRLAGREQRPLRLLVLGGSLGAQALNETLPPALAQLPEAVRPQVRHQTGEIHARATQALYRDHGLEARVEPFIEDMAEAYGWADWVICRAGALTVSELMVVGLAALLIPYPHAIDDHQSRNAQVLVDAQAALVLPQTQLSVQRLVREIRQAFGDRDSLLRMGQAARALARPKAAAAVAEVCAAQLTPAEVSHG